MKAYLLVIPLLISCSNTAREQQINELASLSLKEVSGIEFTKSSNFLWMLQDSGNESILYGIDREGKIKTELTVNIANNDWESLASDNEGNLYIGDFGNNDNDRTNLAIHQIAGKSLINKTTNVSSTITFKYPEQRAYPPAKAQRLFDCEAFFEHNGNFFLFTKNRSSKSDGSFSVYKVPNAAGNHQAQLIGTLKTCGDTTCQVTGADISPDGKKIALITEDKTYVLTGFTHDNYNKVNIDVLDLGHSSQKEGVCFTDNNTLLITDERTKKTGGKIYEVKLPQLKRKV